MELIVLASNPGSSHTLGQTGPAWGHGEASACVRPLYTRGGKGQGHPGRKPRFSFMLLC